MKWSYIANGKTKVAFDYNTDIIGKESLTFKAINTLGEEIEKTIVINDQFYLDMIKHSLVNETETQKALTVNYKEGSTTKQYRIGDSSSWVNYGGTIRLDDYQILETLGGENREVNIDLRQIDRVGNEIIAPIKYTIPESTTYKQEDTVIEGESILACVENNNLESGNYIFRVTGSTDGGTTKETKEYPVELYNYEEDANYITNNRAIIAGITYTGMGKLSSEKRMLILKYNRNLTINNGVTITLTGTNEARNGATYLCTKKGMFIYCAGTLTNNGTITMTAKGTVNQEGENVYLYKNEDNTYEYVPAVGAIGGTSVSWRGTGKNGENGSNRKTGGGASGGVMTFEGESAVSGKGSSGTSYSGGTAGGGTDSDYELPTKGGDGEKNGGKGGNGRTDNSKYGYFGGGGGAGNPGGLIDEKYHVKPKPGETGTGGLIIINANIITNNGNITSNGSAGGYGHLAGGGGSGGGSINIFYKTSINKGTITATGGNGGKCARTTGEDIHTVSYDGGNGGSGSITIGNISTGTFVKDE